MNKKEDIQMQTRYSQTNIYELKKLEKLWLIPLSREPDTEFESQSIKKINIAFLNNLRKVKWYLIFQALQNISVL